MNRKIRRWSIYSNETFIQKIVIKPFYDQYLFISFMTRPVSLLFGMHTNPSLMFATYMCHTTDVWVYLKYFMFLVMLLLSVCKELSLVFLPTITSSWTWQLFLYAMISFINKYNNSISLKQGASLRKSFIYLAYQTFIKTGFLSQFLLIPHILTDIVTTPISNQLLLMIAECLCIPNF